MDRPGLGLRRLTLVLLATNVGLSLVGWGAVAWQGKAVPPVTFNGDKVQLLEDLRPERGAAPATDAPVADGAREQPAQDCVAWASLDADGVAQVQAHLRASGVADADYDLQVGMRLGWWVFIPPLESTAALQVVMDDAKAKGVSDLVPVRVGDMRNALALGTFPGLDGAQRHAQELSRRGLRDVRYAPRPGAGAVRFVVVRDTPGLRGALAAGWPVGLAPDACGPL